MSEVLSNQPEQVKQPSKTLIRIAERHGVSVTQLMNIQSGDLWTSEEEESFRLLVESKNSLPELARSIHNRDKMIRHLELDASDVFDIEEDLWTVKPKIEKYELENSIIKDRFIKLLNIDANDQDLLWKNLIFYDKQYKNE